MSVYVFNQYRGPEYANGPFSRIRVRRFYDEGVAVVTYVDIHKRPIVETAGSRVDTLVGYGNTRTTDLLPRA